jgi:hypothetical protein
MIRLRRIGLMSCIPKDIGSGRAILPWGVRVVNRLVTADI